MHRPASAAIAAAFVLTALVGSTLPALGSGESFTQARFEALQSEGALVLVDVAASWCPTCAKQKAVLERYRAERPNVDLHILRVDFDDQKNWVKHFKAPRQSTLLLFRGAEQVWFAVAETRAEVIFRAIDEAAKAG